MRNAAAVVCFLVLLLGFGDAGALRPKPVKAFAPRVLSPPPPAQVVFPIAPRVINVGEIVTGTLLGSGHNEILYEVTAPSDGLLFVSLDWNPGLGSIALIGQNVVLSYFTLFSVPPAVTTVRVVAGGTYRFWVAATIGYWYYDYDPLQGPVPFVLSTSIVGCNVPPPALSWVCVAGGWVPPGHPLAAPAPPLPPPPPPPIPLGDASACLSIKPGADWICVNGGWLPPGHPGLSVSPNSTPPSTPPVLTNTCTTPDPFIGIPGLSGVCINGGWVPIGHPLARGGG